MNTISIRVEKEDKDRMMKECVEAFLKAHPECEGMNITQPFMFKRLVNCYLGVPQ